MRTRTIHDATLALVLRNGPQQALEMIREQYELMAEATGGTLIRIHADAESLGTPEEDNDHGWDSPPDGAQQIRRKGTSRIGLEPDDTFFVEEDVWRARVNVFGDVFTHGHAEAKAWAYMPNARLGGFEGNLWVIGGALIRDFNPHKNTFMGLGYDQIVNGTDGLGNVRGAYVTQSVYTVDPTTLEMTYSGVGDGWAVKPADS